MEAMAVGRWRAEAEHLERRPPGPSAAAQGLGRRRRGRARPRAKAGPAGRPCIGRSGYGAERRRSSRRRRRGARARPARARLIARSARRARAGARRSARSRGRSREALPISLRPSAQSAAISIAMPARMSGDTSRSPRSRRGPVTIARCGSQRTMSAPIAVSLSVKTRRFSNIHSWISTEPSDWVASATATLVRSAGNAGQGPSMTFALVAAEVGLDDQPLPAGDDDVVAVELAVEAEAVEDEADHPQVVRDRVLDPQLAAGRRRRAP